MVLNDALTADYLAATIATELARPGDRIIVHEDGCGVVDDRVDWSLPCSPTCRPVVAIVGTRGAA